MHTRYRIYGMHCAACEVLVEKKLKKIDGIEKVRVDHVSGRVEVTGARQFSVEELTHAVAAHGYRVSNESEGDVDAYAAGQRNMPRDYKEIIIVFLVLAAGYAVLSRSGLMPQGWGVGDRTSYGIVLLTGLVASVSTCMAVTGGLLLAVGGKYAVNHPELTGFQKFKPHLYFNIGRLTSYGVLGGLVGLIGSTLSPDTRINGIVVVCAGIVMVVLGLRILRMFPLLGRLQPRMPKWIAHRIHALESSSHPSMPFVLGALTFFLPCGFTQALQLYALSTGSFVTGMFTMFVFALGTLPALLSLGAVSSVIKGDVQRYFLKFAGVLVIFVGIMNINSGFALTGWELPAVNIFRSNKIDKNPGMYSNISIENGIQIAAMRVQGLEYYPSYFIVQKGVPVEWRIDGTGAAGCAQVITSPKLRVNEYLPSQGVKIIRFTPQESGDIKFSCSMGMTTPGAKFIVVENVGSPQDPSMVEISGQQGKRDQGLTIEKKTGLDTTCDPKIADCI